MDKFNNYKDESIFCGIKEFVGEDGNRYRVKNVAFQHQIWGVVGDSWQTIAYVPKKGKRDTLRQIYDAMNRQDFAEKVGGVADDFLDENLYG